MSPRTDETHAQRTYGRVIGIVATRRRVCSVTLTCMNKSTPINRSINLILLCSSVLLAGCGGSADTTVGASKAGAKNTSTAPETAKPLSPPPIKETSQVQYSDDAFRLAAHDGNIDIVRKALETGTEVDSPDPDRKYTALLMAAYNGHTHVVKELLKHGANVDARDHEGKTPLMHAASGSFAETVTALIDAGANVNATESTEGFTALMTAAAMGESEVVRVLLERGADPSVVDQDNDTAKDHARNAGKTAIVEMLP